MSTLPKPESSLTGVCVPARFSIEQFDEMVASGVLSGKDDRRYQLFRGEIQYMTPPNPLHDDVLILLNKWAFTAIASGKSELASRVQIRNQASLSLQPGNSVVIPDLVLANDQDYSIHRPNAADTFLVIEVSDTSRNFDLREKCEAYAEAGIREYWVIDIPNRSLVVHRGPAGSRFGSIETHDEQTVIRPELISEICLQPKILFR